MYQTYCCIVRGSDEKRIVDVPRGTEHELQLRRGIGQAACTRNNPHVKCTGVNQAVIDNNADTK